MKTHDVVLPALLAGLLAATYGCGAGDVLGVDAGALRVIGSTSGGQCVTEVVACDSAPGGAPCCGVPGGDWARLCGEGTPGEVGNPPDDGGRCHCRGESGVAAVLEYGPGGQVTYVGAFGGAETTFFRACADQGARVTRSFCEGPDCPAREPRSACWDADGAPTACWVYGDEACDPESASPSEDGAGFAVWWVGPGNAPDAVEGVAVFETVVDDAMRFRLIDGALEGGTFELRLGRGTALGLAAGARVRLRYFAGGGDVDYPDFASTLLLQDDHDGTILAAGASWENADGPSGAIGPLRVAFGQVCSLDTPERGLFAAEHALVLRLDGQTVTGPPHSIRTVELADRAYQLRIDDVTVVEVSEISDLYFEKGAFLLIRTP